MTLVAGERRVKEGVDYLEGKSGADDPCAHGKDVCIVVKPRHLGREAVAAQGGTHAGDFVCGDGDADAGAADDDALFAFAVGNCVCDCFAVNGIVAACVGISSSERKCLSSSASRKRRRFISRTPEFT